MRNMTEAQETHETVRRRFLQHEPERRFWS